LLAMLVDGEAKRQASNTISSDENNRTFVLPYKTRLLRNHRNSTHVLITPLARFASLIATVFLLSLRSSALTSRRCP